MCLKGYASNDGYLSVKPEVWDCLIEGDPISLLELRRIIRAVRLARTENGHSLIARTLKEPGDEAIFGQIEDVLREVHDQMINRKNFDIQHDAIVSSQDPMIFQRRIAILATIAAVASAMSAAGSGYMAYLQYAYQIHLH